jgi:acyl phosphate:glycerol-3-phosphate acyltransferase
MWHDIAVVLVGYLFGSLPFAFLITRWFVGKDIRNEGDGNVGGGNVLRTAGLVPGMLTITLDGAKGASAYLAARYWGSGMLVVYLAGFAMLLGHGFPVWLRFRGGKGLASAAGFLWQAWPVAVTAGLLMLLLMRAISHTFDLSVGVAAATFLAVSIVEGNRIEGVLFVVLFLGLAGLKRLLDLPHERAVRARTGSREGAPHLPWVGCAPGAGSGEHTPTADANHHLTNGHLDETADAHRQ